MIPAECFTHTVRLHVVSRVYESRIRGRFVSYDDKLIVKAESVDTRDCGGGDVTDKWLSIMDSPDDPLHH